MGMNGQNRTRRNAGAERLNNGCNNNYYFHSRGSNSFDCDILYLEIAMKFQEVIEDHIIWWFVIRITPKNQFEIDAYYTTRWAAEESIEKHLKEQYSPPERYLLCPVVSRYHEGKEAFEHQIFMIKCKDIMDNNGYIP